MSAGDCRLHSMFAIAVTSATYLVEAPHLPILIYRYRSPKNAIQTNLTGR